MELGNLTLRQGQYPTALNKFSSCKIISFWWCLKRKRKENTHIYIHTDTSKGTASKLSAAKQLQDNIILLCTVRLRINLCPHTEHIMVIKYRNVVKAENKGQD